MLSIPSSSQECVTLLSQAEHSLAAAHSLRTKLTQDLELRGGDINKSARSELDVSIDMLLEGPELVITEPSTSVVGRSLQGLLAAQVATGVRMRPYVCRACWLHRWQQG